MGHVPLLRLTRALVAGSLLTLIVAGVSLAKCEPGSPEAASTFCQAVVATIDSGASLQAGTDSRIGVTITQGEAPFEAIGAELLFTRVGGGDSLTVALVPTDQPGRYLAEVNLPADGYWTVVAHLGEMSGAQNTVPVATMSVRGLAADSGPATPSAAMPVLPTGLWVLLAVAMMTAATVAIDRRRRRRPAGTA